MRQPSSRPMPPPTARRRIIKIVLDITRLVREGKLTHAEAERLKTLASPKASLISSA